MKIKKGITTHKMGKQILTFGNIEVEKHKFHQHQSPISVYYVNIDRIVVSNKVPFGKKCLNIFLGTKIRMKK